MLFNLIILVITLANLGASILIYLELQDKHDQPIAPSQPQIKKQELRSPKFINEVEVEQKLKRDREWI